MRRNVMCRSCGCRRSRARGLCDRCYKAERKAALAAGTWTPQVRSLVDGAAAAEHLERLARAGISRWQVVRLAGLHHQTIYGIAAGRNVDEKTSAQILAVPIPTAAHAVVGYKAFVPACGTTRRLQALCTLGWPVPKLAELLGNVHLGHLCEVCRGDRELVMAYTAQAVEALYEKLSGTLGPSERVRVVARQRGWAPPLAWAVDSPCECGWTCYCDTNHIDDPQARPAHIRTGQPPFIDRYQDALDAGLTDDVEIAQRLGITERSLARQLAPSRHGRKQHA